MNLALFDLDNTLLAGDSDFEWAQFLIGKGVVDREVQEAKNLQFYEHYKAGTLDIHEFLAFQLAPLARHPRAELDAWHAEYMERHIRPLIGEPARALVRSHLAAGDLCAIVTATNSFVTGPIAREFGIPHLIATDRRGRPGKRGVFRQSVRHAGVPRRQDRPRRELAGISRAVVGQLRRQLLLQRLAQRPAPAGQGADAGRRRSGRHVAPAQCRNGLEDHHSAVEFGLLRTPGCSPNGNS